MAARMACRRGDTLEASTPREFPTRKLNRLTGCRRITKSWSFAVAIPSGTQEAETPMRDSLEPTPEPTANAALARRFIDEVFVRGNAPAVDALVTADFVSHGLPG